MVDFLNNCYSSLFDYTFDSVAERMDAEQSFFKNRTDKTPLLKDSYEVVNLIQNIAVTCGGIIYNCGCIELENKAFFSTVDKEFAEQFITKMEEL